MTSSAAICVPQYGWQNLLGFTGYVNTFTEGQCTYFDGTPVLPQWTGWLVVCAFGFSEQTTRACVALVLQ